MAALTDAQQRIAELTTLNTLAQTLNRATDLRETLDTALGQVVELMGLRTGWIFLHEEGDDFRLAARHELPPALTYPGACWQGGCNCQSSLLTPKTQKNVQMVRCSRLRNAIGDKRSLAQHASVPLMNEHELLGILNVATTEYGRFSPPQMQLLSAVGAMLSTAITRLRLYEQVKIRRVQEQAALLKLSQELLGGESIEPALQRLVRVGARLLEADACAYIEADEQSGYALLQASHGWNKLPEQTPIVIDDANPHLWYLPESASQLAVEALDDLPPLLKAQNFQGHLSYAIEIAGVPVGVLMVNTYSPRRFLMDEAQLLALLGSQLAQTLERERLYQEALASHRFEQELDLARQIQASFLPSNYPAMPGYSMATFYRAARQVGGDFYDFIKLRPYDHEHAPVDECGSVTSLSDDMLESKALGLSPHFAPQKQPLDPNQEVWQRVGFVIADVTDKGVPAALFMARSRTLIRATASNDLPPEHVLAQVNRLMLDDARSGLFVTCFYGILDTETHEFTFADGGHNYPLLYRHASESIEQLHAPGIVLGIMPEPRFEGRNTELYAGDVLCFYTDGVTEAMDSRRHLFSEERLIEVLRRYHHLPPDQIIERILEAVIKFSNGAAQADDITLVILKREV
jgi:serine phosphatase RsbU (regulator of sigma subunit)